MAKRQIKARPDRRPQASVATNPSSPLSPNPPTPGARGSNRLVPTELRRLVTTFPTTLAPRWRPSDIRSALLALRQGILQQPALLADALLEDDEIPGTLSKRINATLRSEFCLKPEDESRDLTKREEAIESLFPEMAPDAELYDGLVSYHLLGVGLWTVDWDTSGDLWMPRLRSLPPEFLQWNWGLKKWLYVAQEGLLEVNPGDGKWVMISQGQRPWLYGLIRALAGLWFSKQHVKLGWDRYCEKHGLPILKARVPVYSEENEKSRFIDDIGAIQAEGIIGVPQDEQGAGYDVEYLETKDPSWETFKANLERIDRKIQVLLIGGNLGTEVASTGSNRAASQTMALNLDREKGKADSIRLGQTMSEQLLDPFMQLNYGVADSDLFPYWDTCPEEDVRAWSDAQDKLADALMKFKQAGYRVTNLEDIGREYGIELEEDDSLLAPPAPPGGTGATDATGGSAPAKGATGAAGKKGAKGGK